ncbi:tyrosine-type recombinase/integrase [Micromonospora chalcea]|uniref:tyrosine-type recombinase/integrase n=1 Tax=Micromonospora chalcea TaxID=1874 RepID=UPI0021A960A5|nr:tyrosine-type recombinase/integrase [Micromonospora chalcea]MCT2278105.1 tyrosine-type recombinase/integrase [Micromonospora chalcea]
MPYPVDTAHAPHSHDLIAGYLRHLAALGRADTTRDTYADELCRLDRRLPEGLVYACADELRDAIHNGERGAAHIAKITAAVTGFYAWATRPSDPYLDFNPATDLPRAAVKPRRPRPITNDELADILRRAREPMRTWYLLAAGNGLRCVEISRLDRADVTEQATWIRGKGGKERIVPTHPAVWTAVKDLPSGPVARNRDGSHANRVQVQERANYHLQRTLGHRAVSMHRLRHWHGTYVHQAAGGDIRVTQELLGHASPNTTSVYVATIGGAKAAAVHALPLPV